MEKNFFKVPNHLFEHGLSCKAIVVYCCLMRHAGEKLKYTVIRELKPTILRTFISKIVIHEREVPHCKTSPQQIDIYFRFIGNIFSVDQADVIGYRANNA